MMATGTVYMTGSETRTNGCNAPSYVANGIYCCCLCGLAVLDKKHALYQDNPHGGYYYYSHFIQQPDEWTEIVDIMRP